MAAPGRPSPPAKPWERAGSSGPSPFAPPSATNSTAAAVATSAAASDDPKDGTGRVVSIVGDENIGGRQMPARPWEQGRSGYGSGAISNYGQSGLYNSGGYGGAGMYGGGMGMSSYGSPYQRSGMYGGGYGSSMYGSSYGGMGGGMYGNRYGGGYGGGYGGMGGMGGSYGMGGMGVGYGQGPGDPNFPGGEPPPPQAPSFWQTLLQGLYNVMSVFGRLSMLVDENTQAIHFFITALLQLCDRAGMLYGELARFVLPFLGFRGGSRARARSKASAKALERAQHQPGQGMDVKTPPEPAPAWDNVWKDGN